MAPRYKTRPYRLCDGLSGLMVCHDGQQRAIGFYSNRYLGQAPTEKIFTKGEQKDVLLPL